MKVDTVKVHTMVIFHAAALDQIGLKLDEQMRLLSLSPFEYTVEPLDELLGRIKGEAVTPMLGKALLGMGVKHKVTVSNAENDIVYGKHVKGDTYSFMHFGNGLVVMSEFDRVMVTEEYVPMEVARKMFKDKPITAHPVEASVVMLESINEARQRQQFAKSLGIPVDAEEEADFERMLREGEDVANVVRGWTDADKGKRIGDLPGDQQGKLRKLLSSYAERVGVGVEEVVAKTGTIGGVKQTNVGELLQVDEMRFVKAQATDLLNAGLQHGDHYHEIPAVRVAHIGAPVWHEADEAAQAQGYIGHWEFEHGALVSNAMDAVPKSIRDQLEEDDAEIVTMSFGVASDGHTIKVAVKSQDAISPAGEIAIPSPLYVQLFGHEPEGETMGGTEMAEFNKLHMAPWPRPEARGPFAMATKPATARKAN